mmetsp:Transcript_24913/g.52073  ORF Transcript_24913/g.52073 Transcript_24913/m.52073 type:complete len:94 (+) Transcript_24913:56-337(+)
MTRKNVPMDLTIPSMNSAATVPETRDGRRTTKMAALSAKAELNNLCESASAWYCHCVPPIKQHFIFIFRLSSQTSGCLADLTDHVSCFILQSK